MKPSAQPKPTIGAMLSARREHLGIPIERAAKDSRIRAQRLREIEEDNFSEFSNASYARMFLIAYAKYLGIPREDLDAFLPEQGMASADNYQYIQGASQVLPTIRYEPKTPPSPKKRLMVTVFSVILITALVCGAAMVTYLAINLPRITSALEESRVEPDPVATTEPVPPVIPPGMDTIRTVAFENTVSITVSEMIVTAAPAAFTLPEADSVELPDDVAAVSPVPTIDTGESFAGDMEFLLGSSSSEQTEADRVAPTN